MFGRLRMRPWEIKRMTLAEIVLAMDDADLESPRPPAGSRTFSSPEERQKYAEWLTGLTAMQRLELARDGQVSTEVA